MTTKCKLHTVDAHPETGKLYCPDCKRELTIDEATAVLHTILQNWTSVEFALNTLKLTGMLINASTEMERRRIEREMRALQKMYLNGNK